jgi:WD40 repeat protein
MLSMDEYVNEAYNGALPVQGTTGAQSASPGTKLSMTSGAGGQATFIRLGTNPDGTLFAKQHGDKTSKTEPVNPGTTYNGVKWSPNGRILAYLTTSGIYTYEYDPKTSVFTLTGQTIIGLKCGSWDPTSTYFVASTNSTNGVFYYKYTYGSGLTELAQIALANTIYHVDWSSDGNYISVATGTNTGSTSGYVRMVYVDKSTDPWTFTLLTSTQIGLVGGGANQPTSTVYCMKWTKDMSLIAYELNNIITIYTKNPTGYGLTKSSVTADVAPVAFGLNASYTQNAMSVTYQNGRCFVAICAGANPSGPTNIDIYEYIRGTSFNKISSYDLSGVVTTGGYAWQCEFSPNGEWLAVLSYGRIGYSDAGPFIFTHKNGVITFTNKAACQAPVLTTTGYSMTGISWGA